jgi:hypothetical protein
MSEEKIKRPDFIICGAMKSGTTTLRGLLNQQDFFYLPNKEIHYFCADDIIEHAPFIGRKSKKWYWNKYGSEKLKKWYYSQFSNAHEGAIIGEDSTMYMCSSEAAFRIKKELPDVKLIFVLRNPVERAWSQYWHLVRSGRAMWSFEKTLEIQPATLLSRGLYREQIMKYLNFFDSKDMMFVMLEDIKNNPSLVVEKVSNFLGREIDRDSIVIQKTHFHLGTYPKFLKLQLMRNRFLQGIDRRLYQNHYPEEIKSSDLVNGILPTIIEKLSYKINPYSGRDYKMNMETRQMLNEYYSIRNEGLAEIVKREEVNAWS